MFTNYSPNYDLIKQTQSNICEGLLEFSWFVSKI